MVDFGYTLKRYRERTGLSQSKLAEKAEFDHSYLCRLESGERQPARSAVDRIVKALGLQEPDTSILMGSAGFMASQSPIELRWPVLTELATLLEREAVGIEYSGVRGRLERFLIDFTRIARDSIPPAPPSQSN
jgi:transcriptional regulator with XRE-family HTH domain